MTVCGHDSFDYFTAQQPSNCSFSERFRNVLTYFLTYVDRSIKRVLHRFVHGGDAAQGVQSRPAGLPHVTVQSVRLFRRALQHRGGHLQLHRRHASTRRQRSAMCEIAASLQGYTVY